MVWEPCLSHSLSSLEERNIASGEEEEERVGCASIMSWSVGPSEEEEEDGTKFLIKTIYCLMDFAACSNSLFLCLAISI